MTGEITTALMPVQNPLSMACIPGTTSRRANQGRERAAEAVGGEVEEGRLVMLQYQVGSS